MKKNIRLLAILLLDDQDGINEEAFNHLSSMLHETGNQDILDAVEANDDRYWIGEDDAAILKERPVEA